MILNQFEEYFKMFFDKSNFYSKNLGRLLPTGVVDHVWSRSKMSVKLRCIAFIRTSVAISLPSVPIPPSLPIPLSVPISLSILSLKCEARNQEAIQFVRRRLVSAAERLKSTEHFWRFFTHPVYQISSISNISNIVIYKVHQRVGLIIH